MGLNKLEEKDISVYFEDGIFLIETGEKDERSFDMNYLN